MRQKSACALSVNPLVRSRVDELGVNGAFAGIESGQVVYLYRSDAFSDENRIGLPYRVPLYRSNIAIAILAMSLPPGEALERFRADIHARHAEHAAKADLAEIRDLLEHVARNGYLFRREPEARWNITFPVEYGGQFYGVSFYGDRAGERNFDRLLFDVSFVPDPAWSEEVVLTLMSYMAVLSAALAIRRNAHIRMTAFDAYLPKNVIKVLDILADVAVFILAIVMITVGFSYATGIGAKGNYVSMPWLSKFWMYFPIPLAGVAMVVFELEAIYNHIKSIFVKEGTK